MQHEHTDIPGHESLVRHPIHGAVQVMEHLYQVGDEGESPATPAIVVGAVLAFIVPLAATFMLVGLLIWYFA